ncbi:MAG: hypothetical protein IPI67_28145 [Myxococcales bacterium]|nr:hypothetical protein [Myxococcales bacterium]
MLRQDYIGRLIQQLAEALARAARRVKEDQLDEADAEIAAAEQALGLPRGLELFDPRSAALLLGGGDKVVLAALLLEHRALVASARGATVAARQKRARALSLLGHATPHELGKEAAELRTRLGEASAPPES